MMRVIHLFQLKPGASEQRMLELIDGEWATYVLSKGCIERRTMRLFEARGGDEQRAPYLNEALWPDQATADNAFAEMPERIRNLQEELFAIMDRDNGATFSYVDF